MTSMGKKGNQGEQTPRQGSKQAGRGGNMFRRQTRPKNEGTQVPVLHYGPENNFQRFKEKMAAEALKKYGDLGLLIETERYYEPPEVQLEN